MGSYSDLRIAITKKDYIKMLEKDKDHNICKYILDKDNAYVKEYTDNNVECVLLQQFDLKYYKEFDNVKLFEKYLAEAKNGYVFMRIGGGWDDIEYRNTAKYKELEVPFKFIKIIEDKNAKQLLNKRREYELTAKQYVFTNKNDILEFYENNKIMYNFIKNQYNENSQFKLFLEIDMDKRNALSVLHTRKPEEERYSECRTEYVDRDGALLYLGYPNDEQFLNEINDINKEEEELE